MLMRLIVILTQLTIPSIDENQTLATFNSDSRLYSHYLGLIAYSISINQPSSSGVHLVVIQRKLNFHLVQLRL